MVSSSRGLMFGAALVLACSAAPSSVPAPPAPPPQPPAAEDALANARRLAKAAHGIRPPALPNATKEDALAWLKGDLAAWLVLRRAACVEAEAEYLSAARRAPAEKTTALLEAADVWLEFADEFAVAAKGGASY